MKHHSLRNKALLERLTKQYSKGEVEESFFGDLMRGRIGKQQRKMAKLPNPEIDYERLASLGDEDDFDDVTKIISAPDELDDFNDATEEFDADATEILPAPDSSEIETSADNLKRTFETQSEKLENLKNQIIALMIASGVSREQKIFTDTEKAMNDAIKSLDITDSEAKTAVSRDGAQQLSLALN